MKKILIAIVFTSLVFHGFTQPEINCDSVHTDPAESEYILPYGPGETFTVTQSYCHPSGGHYLTFAYDFNTQIGDTIRACRAGTVTFSNDQYADTDWTSGHENNVFIRHSDGTRIRYTHLMQGGALVEANDEIEQGQAIGISGNSGNTGGFPHLHLAAFKDGTSFDRQNTIPINFCNTNDPVDDQNLLIEGQSYTAFEKDVTAVQTLNEKENFNVFPIPTSEFLNIEINDSGFNLKRVQLVNLNGQRVYHKELERVVFPLKISVDEIPAGIYFLILSNEIQFLTKRVLVISER